MGPHTPNLLSTSVESSSAACRTASLQELVAQQENASSMEWNGPCDGLALFLELYRRQIPKGSRLSPFAQLLAGGLLRHD